jgi:hypothetical protein
MQLGGSMISKPCVVYNLNDRMILLQGQSEQLHNVKQSVFPD